jgi:hypothetical protein
MDEQETISFAPFAAVNDFMLADFRNSVIQTVLEGSNQLPVELRQQLDTLSKALVTVQGFRNPLKAPVRLRARATSKPFEKSSELAAMVIAGWAYLKPTLAQQVYNLLSESGWDLLPVESDRLVMPGFLPVWPSGSDFESVFAAFVEKYPEHNFSQDEVSLMVVWLSLRLPYGQENDTDDEDQD